MKRERGIPADRPPYLCFNSIVMNETVEGLPAVAEKLAQMGGRVHVLLGLISHMSAETVSLLKEQRGSKEAAEAVRDYEGCLKASAFNGKKLDPDILAGIRQHMYEVYRRAGIHVEDQLNFLGTVGAKEKHPSGAPVCYFPWFRVHIRENGDVTPCCANNILMGNVAKDSFDEIWNGATTRDLRRAFAHGEMKGCDAAGCPEVYNYFFVAPSSRLISLWDSFASRFPAPENVRSILLLRTARDYECHLVAKTLMDFFPKARFTVITNPSGAADCRNWLVPASIEVYPHPHFSPDAFNAWWGERPAAFDVAAFVYNNAGRQGYGEVEAAVRSIDARHVMGIIPGSGIMPL